MAGLDKDPQLGCYPGCHWISLPWKIYKSKDLNFVTEHLRFKVLQKSTTPESVSDTCFPPNKRHPYLLCDQKMYKDNLTSGNQFLMQT